MKVSARRTLAAAVIAMGLTAGGTATATASEPDDPDGPTSELTGQLSADRVLEALDAGGSSDESGSPERADLERELAGRLEPFVGSGDDSRLRPVNELVCELTGDEFELLELTPTEIELLGPCPAASVVDDDKDGPDDETDERDDKDDKDDEKKDEPADEQEHDNDDSGTVPVGGIETGAGGTAGGGAPALGLLGGGIALTAAGATLAARRLGRLG